MTYARWYPTCTTLPDGRILAISGKDEFEEVVEFPEIYDPASNTWQEMTNPLAEKLLRLYPFMFVVPHPDPLVHRVFFAGPGVANDKETWMLDIDGQSWQFVDESPFNGAVGSAVMFEPGWVLKAGGTSPSPFDENLTAWIDLNVPSDTGGEWQLVDDMEQPRRRHNLVLLPYGKILAVGGEQDADPDPEIEDWQPVFSAEWFDPNDPILPEWQSLAVMTYERRYHSTAVLLPDGKVLSAGSWPPSHPDAVTAEIFSPPYLFGGERPVIGFAPTEVQYGQEFTVVMTLAGIQPIAKVSFLRLGAVTHGFDQNQRYVPLDFTVVAGNSATVNVHAPANANLAPPGYYMLFLVSDDGVPSVAKYVRLSPIFAP